MNKKALFLLTILLLPIVYAIDFTPQGNIVGPTKNGTPLYSIYNFSNISALNYYGTFRGNVTYNETDPIYSANIVNYYNKSQSNSLFYNISNPSNYINSSYVDGNFLNISDQRYNESLKIDSLNNSKLNISDQRYNDTALINAVNTTSNIQSLGFYNSTYLNPYLTSGGARIYWFTNQTNTAGFRNMTLTLPNTTLITLSYPITTSKISLGTFITPYTSSETVFAGGVRHIVVTTYVTDLNKIIELQAVVSRCVNYNSTTDTCGSIVGFANSTTASCDSTTPDEHIMTYYVANTYILNSSDRFLVNITAIKTSGGNTNINFNIDDNSFSRIEVPSPVGVTDISGKLDATDQRYNDTALITSVNSSTNLRIDSLNLTKLNITDQRYNDSAAISLKADTTLLTQFANKSANNIFTGNNTHLGYEYFNYVSIVNALGSYTNQTLLVQDATGASKIILNATSGTGNIVLDGTVDGVDVSNLGAGFTALNTSFWNQDVVTREPTGFVDRTTSTLSFNNLTRNLTIVGTYPVYINGTVTYHTNDSVVVPNITGITFIYYNDGLIVQSATPWSFKSNAMVASVYWNSQLGQALIADERHGIAMDWITHEYLHETIGARYVSGLTGTFNDVAFNLTTGEWYDEDLEFIPLATSTCNVVYKTGANTTWLYNQTQYYFKNATNMYYDNGGVLTAVGANNYMAIWMFETNDKDVPVYCVLGQRTDTSLANAVTNNVPSSVSLGNLPVSEMKLLYRVIVRNDATPYEPTGTVDYRNTQVLASGTFTTTSHGSLTGLTNDDHLQYLLVDGSRNQTTLTVTGNITEYGTLLNAKYSSITALNSVNTTAVNAMPKAGGTFTGAIKINTTSGNTPFSVYGNNNSFVQMLVQNYNCSGSTDIMAGNDKSDGTSSFMGDWGVAGSCFNDSNYVTATPANSSYWLGKDGDIIIASGTPNKNFLVKLNNFTNPTTAINLSQTNMSMGVDIKMGTKCIWFGTSSMCGS